MSWTGCNSLFSSKSIKRLVFISSGLCFLYFCYDITSKYATKETATEVILSTPQNVELPSFSLCYYINQIMNYKAVNSCVVRKNGQKVRPISCNYLADEIKCDRCFGDIYNRFGYNRVLNEETYNFTQLEGEIGLSVKSKKGKDLEFPFHENINMTIG